ncbi:MAG: NUDIX domain-containing protein [Nanoarchaeota archaeon]
MINERKAVRAILFNNNKEVAVMNVAENNYHKIPGGGVEDGEDLQMALIREIKEEAGATARVITELGRIIEKRTKYSFKQESFCFIAEALTISVPEFTDDEKKAGFSISWMPLEKAINLFEKERPEEYSAKFMHFRDLCFLMEAKKSDKFV